MNPTELESLIAQNFLRVRGYYQGALDGRWGPISKRAANAWFADLKPSAINGTSEAIRAAAAQTHLLQIGLYKGEIDGKWGPLSRAAAANWESSKSPISKVPINGSRNQPYDLAKTYLHEKEIPGVKNNPTILGWLRRWAPWVDNDETAWCSAFVNHCAEETGYERTGKLNARSWLDVGIPVPIDQARPSDVVILWRGRKDGWEGHVAFLDHFNATRQAVYLLGGNQGNEVNISSYAPDRILGIRRLRSLDQLQGSSNKV